MFNLKLASATDKSLPLKYESGRLFLFYRCLSRDIIAYKEEDVCFKNYH